MNNIQKPNTENHMNDYYILWTYYANYSDKPVKIVAHNANEAVRNFAKLYSADFQRRAKVYCFESPPTVWYNGEVNNTKEVNF